MILIGGSKTRHNLFFLLTLFLLSFVMHSIIAIARTIKMCTILLTFCGFEKDIEQKKYLTIIL